MLFEPLSPQALPNPRQPLSLLFDSLSVGPLTVRFARPQRANSVPSRRLLLARRTRGAALCRVPRPQLLVFAQPLGPQFLQALGAPLPLHLWRFTLLAPASSLLRPYPPGRLPCRFRLGSQLAMLIQPLGS